MKVGIIMGSDSDLPVMSEAAKILDELKVDYELTVISAHRTPDRMYDYAKKAKGQGFGVIIAGAGGAAHLPGMVASMTTLPVVGVPIKTRTMSGIDSLYSIVQMPAGILVATLAINGAKNAGILAASILSISDEKLAQRLATYKNELKAMVEDKAMNLEEIGYKNYLDNM